MARSDGDAVLGPLDLVQLFGDGARCTGNYFTATDLAATHGPHMATAAAGPECHLLVETKFVPLPAALAAQYDRLECRTYMGLFPDIDRAWITVDHRLFFWDYLRNEHVLVKEFEHVITAVGLVTPAPDIFIDEVKYLLVVATAGHVSLLCIKPTSPKGPPGTSCHLDVRNPDISVPADGASFRTIVGTRDGRIFLGGEDGHVHELCYQDAQGWWSNVAAKLPFSRAGDDQPKRKIHKRNHTRNYLQILAPTFVVNMAAMFTRSFADDPVVHLALAEDRGWLYVLHASNCIRVIDVRRDKFQVGPFIADVADQVAHLCMHSNVTDRRKLKIVAIQPVARDESNSVYLVAITNTSLRLYLGVRPDLALSPALDAASNGTDPALPSTMHVLYVRLPPNRDIPQSMGQPSRLSLDQTLGTAAERAALAAGPFTPNTHLAYYARGLLLTANNATEHMDSILCAALDSALVHHQLASAREYPRERAHVLHVDGRTWDIVEVDFATMRSASTSLAAGPVDPRFAEDAHPRHFLVLSSEGVRVLAKHRPIDELAYLVRMDVRDVRQFMSVYGADVTCAWLLALLCRNDGAKDTHPFLAPRTAAAQGARWPTAASANAANQVAESQVRRLFFQSGGMPREQPGEARRGELGIAVAPLQYAPSACAKGLDLYLKRLVAPIWKLPVLSGKGAFQVKEATLTKVQADLTKLVAFIDTWPAAHEMAAAVAGFAAEARAGVPPAQDDRWRADRAFLHKRFEDARLALEAVRFTLVLARRRFTDLVSRMPADVAHTLTTQPFEYLISEPGRAFCGKVAAALVQLAPGAGVTGAEPLAPQLEGKCPTLLRVEDIYTTAVLEKLQGVPPPGPVGVDNVVVATHPAIDEAVALATQYAAKFDATQFAAIAQRLLQLHCVRAVLDLALLRAAERDPADAAVAYATTNDPARRAVYEERIACYQLAITALAWLHDRVTHAGDAAARHTWAKVREDVHRRALHSSDKLWHFALYEWYASLAPTLLLDLHTEYLEEWLQTQPDVEKQELLAQFYVARRQFDVAAQTLLALAQAQTVPDAAGNAPATVSLAQRIDWLQRALQTAKASMNTDVQAHVQDLLDLALLQQHLRGQLAAMGEAEAAHELEVTPVKPLQDLFELAQAYDLKMMQFRLMAAAAEDVDRTAMADLWALIFDSVDPHPAQLEAQLAEMLAVGASWTAATGSAEVPAAAAAAAAISSPLLAPDLWVPVVVDITQRSADARTDRHWWLRVASRAGIDLEAVYFALEQAARQARRRDDQALLVGDLVACLELWGRHAAATKAYLPSTWHAAVAVVRDMAGKCGEVAAQSRLDEVVRAAGPAGVAVGGAGYF
ncbi:hypothetical protein GGF32_007788 [Allomyces javanicus]|nr:hypothetical protein GGF32_007788 [Allomyces javanicus]